MRKTFVAIIAATTMGAAFADASYPEQYQQQFHDQPAARAYLSYSFGGHNDRTMPAPLHYGLRLDHESRAGDGSFGTLPAVLQLDHDSRGQTLASASGITFAGRNLRLHQSDSSGSSSSTGGGSDSGWSFFDWTLLAVGVGGAGYLIYDATKGHDSPDAKPGSGSGSSSSGGGCILGIIGKGCLTSDGSGINYEQVTPEQIQWLDGGTGHMGDLSRR